MGVHSVLLSFIIEFIIIACRYVPLFLISSVVSNHICLYHCLLAWEKDGLFSYL